jgi:predicted phosphodiesterase
MTPSFFSEIIGKRFNPNAVLDLRAISEGKVLIISDFHMGSGKRDDFQVNSEIVINILEKYYFENGWYLILNGDIEELAKFSLSEIRASWAEMYKVLDLFAAEGRLYKTLGNHDEDLIFEKGYPYPLYNAIRIETGLIPIYVYHGHQSSRVYTSFNNLIRLSLRYLLKPFGIRNISSARNPHRRFSVERKAYNFSLSNNCISIIGHTHRSLFESLSRFDYIKFEIERLCRDYPSVGAEEKEKIAEEVSALRLELGKLKRKERREGLNLYGDELPVPCLFNSGSAIGKKGINAIELDASSIALVYWFAEGKGMKFVSRGSYEIENYSGFCRAVLNQDKLDYVKGKIELFSNGKEQK